jgi:hypothetical protein
VHVAIPPWGASGFSIGQRERTPWEAKVVLILLGGSIPAALFTEVFLEHGSPKLPFGFTEFYEVRARLQKMATCL